MNMPATAQGPKIALLAMLAVCAIALGAGCGPDKTQDHSSASPAPGTNPPTPTPNPGGSTENRVLRLDGKTASLRVPDSPSLHSLTNAMTLEVWFKAASFYRQNGAVNSLLRKNVEANGENFFLRFRILSGQPVIEMSSGNQVLRAPYDFEPGTWYHLAGTYDGKVMTVLVNGVVAGSQRFSGSIQMDDSDLMIGKGDPNFSSGEYFHGDIDEVRLWNVARSPEQIRAAMNTRLTGKEPGLAAYWTFDDGTANDVSTNGNKGVLDGETQILAVTPPDAPPLSSSPKR